MLLSASKAVVSLFTEKDADSTASLHQGGLSCCRLCLSLPPPCLTSAPAAKLEHIAHTLLVFQKTMGVRNSTYFKNMGGDVMRCF